MIVSYHLQQNFSYCGGAKYWRICLQWLVYFIQLNIPANQTFKTLYSI